MIDITEFEQQLRIEVAEAEANALMSGGVYTGLTKALSLITGDQEFERANAAVLSWLRPSA